MVFFRHEITGHTDEIVWIRIVFFLALSAIGFTFWCKWKEDELLRDRDRKEKKEKILRLQKDAVDRIEYDRIRNELGKIMSQVIDIKNDNLKKIKAKIDEQRRKLKLIGEKNIDKHYKTGTKILDTINALEQKLHAEQNDIEKIERESVEEDVPKEKGDKTSSGQLLIFAAVYAIIGGLAITQALLVFSNPDQNQQIIYAHNFGGFIDLISSKPAFLIASFFSIAILFIHCGIVFLSTDARKIISAGNKAGFFISSLLVFLEGVVVFYASNTIDNILNFSFWIFLLMLIDIIWVFINIAKSIDVVFQWLHLDSIMLFFLLAILIVYQSVPQIMIEVYAYVLIIFLARTIADYKMGWKSVWGKFDVSDAWT